MAEYGKGEAKAWARGTLRAIITAPALPERDGEVDEEGLRHDVRHCLDVIGASGLYIHGFYGNFWLLTTDERRHVLEVVVDEVAGEAVVICRCAHQSLRDTIALMCHAEEAGADMISLLGPWQGQASDDMVFRFFELAAAETTLGITVFNTGQAGYAMSPDLLARIAEIENVAALKNHMPPEHTNAVRAKVGDAIVVVDPEEENFLVNLLEHGQRVIYTGTNMMFDSAGARPMKDYVDAALTGDAELATELFERMQPIRDVHHRWVIEPWQRTGLCPVATVKCWAQQLGMTGGPARPPLPDLTAAERGALIAELAEVGLNPTSPPVA